jgi:hypothetical protein
LSIAIGIALGSLAAGFPFVWKIEYGLNSSRIAGHDVSSFLLGIPSCPLCRCSFLLRGLGFAGGFFIVPINALMQHRPRKTRRAGDRGCELAFFVGVERHPGRITC